MTIRQQSDLKAFFETGDRPTQAQFSDLIDSSAPDHFTTVAALLADTTASYPTGMALTAAGYRYTVAAPGATDHHLVTAPGGVKLYISLDTYDPRALGWQSGDDIGAYLEQFWVGPWALFAMPPSSSATIADVVTMDAADASAPIKLIDFGGASINFMSASAKIMICNTDLGGALPFVFIRGGKVNLYSDASVGYHVKDINNVSFEQCAVFGNTSNSPSRGTAWLLENSHGYTERTVVEQCSSYYCRHALRFHLSGGAGGGLSFARTIVHDLFISGGVSGSALITITTAAEVSLAVTNANLFTVGETVTQAVTGATGVVLGYPEGNDVIFLGSVSGTFNTANSITGGTSGQTRTPTNARTNRHPNVYDSMFHGIRGNCTSGSIIMDLGGSMRGTYITGLGFESTAAAYYFRPLPDADDQPIIYGPDLGLNMALMSGSATKKPFGAHGILGGVQIITSDVSPDTSEGVLAVADGFGWNPATVGSGNGGRGLFLRIGGVWRRVQLLTTTTTTDLASAANTINTSDKYQGKEVTTTDGGSMTKWIANGASATSKWTPQRDSLSEITPA